MLQLKINGELVEVKEGTRVIDLLADDEKCNYMVCKLGTQVKELNRKLSEKDNGKTIEFLGLENIEAGKAYEASLRYVFAMAFHNLYPDVKIRFSYNASRSVFCQVLTPGFNMSRETDAIKDEVDRIIKQNLSIERITVTTDEAREIYADMGFDDKLAMLKYRPESLVHIYKCGDYYDYLHSYMVPSTGCIFSYCIRRTVRASSFSTRDTNLARKFPNSWKKACMAGLCNVRIFGLKRPRRRRLPKSTREWKTAKNSISCRCAKQNTIVCLQNSEKRLRAI